MSRRVSGGRVFVIGAGLAGLAAAVALVRRGRKVDVYEATAQAGGRCRSYFDPELDMVIDNGNHLVLSGNRATMDYLGAIGSLDRLTGPDQADFPFCDVRDGRTWRVRPNPGPLAWWVLHPGRRPPGTRAADYLGLLGLLGPQSARRRVDEAMRCEGALWERLLRPFLLAALNTEPEGASAALAGAVIRETMAKGGRAYRPRIATPNLSAAFIEPAVDFLRKRGASVRLGQRLRRLAMDGDRVTALAFGGRCVGVGDGDAVIVATPPWISAGLVPDLVTPNAFQTIVNAHFACAAPDGAAPIVGVIGGAAEWIFAFPDRLSVTVSAAEHLANDSREDLAMRFWRDIGAVHGLGPKMPPWRIVRERRATFASLPAQAIRRPGTRTPWRNLLLAGDWTDTGLPATIEGAIRSGQKAAVAAARWEG